MKERRPWNALTYPSVSTIINSDLPEETKDRALDEIINNYEYPTFEDFSRIMLIDFWKAIFGWHRFIILDYWKMRLHYWRLKP
jgi:hypothetical protein